ncbi:hypothetical protein [Streptomyces sp. NPDC002491]
MRVTGKRRFLAYRADTRRYRLLMDHCLACTACRADTSTECPQATVLRRAWHRARGGETV